MNQTQEYESASQEPLYNIGVVSRITGLSMATLRAWERRYDFPEAGRTAGGHRLYSERDVARLRWVKARIDEGMQTSQAIQALHRQEETGDLVYVDPFREEVAERKSPEPQNLDEVRERMLSALRERRTQAANQVLGEALAIASPEDIILQVISPALNAIGESWEHGEISVATEHLTTSFLRHRLLVWMMESPPPAPGNPVVLACAPGEWHEGSLLILGALLRRRRRSVAYLGQAVPLADLGEFVRQIQPALVVNVAMTAETAANLEGWPEHIPQALGNGKPVFGYGGRIFTQEPEWRMRVPGLYLGDSLEQGLRTIEKLLDSKR